MSKEMPPFKDMQVVDAEDDRCTCPPGMLRLREPHWHLPDGTPYLKARNRAERRKARKGRRR